ncbi:hypothetical protein CRE_04954 [Caenorhabditis remanei]|uniref:Uncharacterized protein n=2 Tax=Caenorhabditis remanei TaxID=31234 RepID=E3MN59_CAERE|nr:hypothetical protein CRE_04954 [Caenorhabditis remanei]
MSSLHIARLLILISIMSTVVVSYSVLPSGDQASGIRFWPPVYERSEFSDDIAPNDFDDSRMKREDLEQQLSKRTNLKRLVILSARGFGKK